MKMKGEASTTSSKCYYKVMNLDNSNRRKKNQDITTEFYLRRIIQVSMNLELI